MVALYSPVSGTQYEAWDLLHDKQTKYIMFGGGAGGGKSWLAWLWLVSWCYAYPGTRYFAARLQLKDIKDSGLGTFAKVLDVLGIDRGGWYYHGSEHYLVCLRTGSRIDLVELRTRPTDPDFNRLGSKEYTSGIIEEAQEIEAKPFDVLKARIGRQHNDKYKLKPMILLTANPDKGWLYDTFYDPWRRGSLPTNMAFVKSLARDNPFLPSTYHESLDDIDDDVTRQRLRDGRWDYDNDPRQLINPEWYTAALSVPARDGVGRMGVDPAGGDYGYDDNCIVKLTGNMIHPIFRKRYKNTTSVMAEEEFADEVVFQAGGENPILDRDIRIDTQGVGAGLYSVLRTKGFECTRFAGHARQLKRKGQKIDFENLRSQAAWELREKLRKGELHLMRQDSKLKSALTAYRFDSDGKTVKLEDKKITRKRINRSPDEGDALMMAALDFPKRSGKVRVSRLSSRRPEV